MIINKRYSINLLFVYKVFLPQIIQLFLPKNYIFFFSQEHHNMRNSTKKNSIIFLYKETFKSF